MDANRERFLIHKNDEIAEDAVKRLTIYLRDYSKWEYDQVRFGKPATIEKIQAVEDKLGIKFPKSYRAYMQNCGPFSLCTDNLTFDQGLFKILNLDDVFEFTDKIKKKYTNGYFHEQDPLREKLIPIFENLVLFQYVDNIEVDDLYGFYTGELHQNEMVIKKLDHDHVERVQKSLAMDFNNHISRLVDKLIRDH